MSQANQCRVERVRSWLAQIAPLRDPGHPLGQLARQILPRETGLSDECVQWGFDNAFETDASDAELQLLVDSTAESPRAHVLLSSNVFVGALRALAVAMASSSVLCVRPSRREPVMAELLLRAAPGAFTLVSELDPSPGDHLWAFGADTTLSHLKSTLPAGVILHGHGSGFGVVVVDAGAHLADDDIAAIALDVAAFDQRGCLSPKFVLLEGNQETGNAFAQRLVAALERIMTRLPRGAIDSATLTEDARHRELWHYLGTVFHGPGGTVTVDSGNHAWGRPPTNRTLHVHLTCDAVSSLADHGSAITAVSSRDDATLRERIESILPRARWSRFGFMQRPRLDGPADRRTDPAGVAI